MDRDSERVNNKINQIGHSSDHRYTRALNSNRPMSTAASLSFRQSATTMNRNFMTVNSNRKQHPYEADFYQQNARNGNKVNYGTSGKLSQSKGE